MAPLPSAQYRIRAINEKNPGPPMCATQRASGEQICIQHENPGDRNQLWDVICLDEEKGGHHICALGDNVNPDQAFMRNEMNGRVVLGQAVVLSVSLKKENEGLYSICGPYRAGTYGASDWLGVVDNQMVQRTGHSPPDSLDTLYGFKILKTRTQNSVPTMPIKNTK